MPHRDLSIYQISASYKFLQDKGHFEPKFLEKIGVRESKKYTNSLSYNIMQEFLLSCPGTKNWHKSTSSTFSVLLSQ